MSFSFPAVVSTFIDMTFFLACVYWQLMNLCLYLLLYSFVSITNMGIDPQEKWGTALRPD